MNRSRNTYFSSPKKTRDKSKSALGVIKKTALDIMNGAQPDLQEQFHFLKIKLQDTII